MIPRKRRKFPKYKYLFVPYNYGHMTWYDVRENWGTGGEFTLLE